MTTDSKTWAVIGASRGIGHEFVKQLLGQGHRLIATTRGGQDAASLWPGSERRCQLYECDMLSETSIDAFVGRLVDEGSVKHIDTLVLNAGVLKYPNRATELSYASLLHHLQTNTIGPIITAQRLLSSPITISKIVFISSDSGSASRFLAHEDGFAAYGASKAALNMMLRHMAAELERKGSETVVLALHPGEVNTDMAKEVDLGWEVKGQMTPEQSVRKCIGVIEGKGSGDSGTFWTWEDEVYPW